MLSSEARVVPWTHPCSRVGDFNSPTHALSASPITTFFPGEVWSRVEGRPDPEEVGLQQPGYIPN